MKKLLLSACLAAACWTSDVGAMSEKRGELWGTRDEKILNPDRPCSSKTREAWTKIGHVSFLSIDNQCLMVTRDKLGENLGWPDRSMHARYLHIDYNGKIRSSDKITYSELKTLPESIGHLGCLELLHVSGGGNWGPTLEILPESIGRLRNLRTLHLSGCSLEKLPESIGNLQNLRRLIFEQLYCWKKPLRLPESIGNLQNLRELELQSGKIYNIPESIGNLQNLQELKLITRDLWGGLPESIGNLQNLQELEMNIGSESVVGNLPESIGNLRNLRVLKLSGHMIHKFPKSIGNLQNLRLLNFEHTQIRNLPDSMVNLTNLESVHFSEAAKKAWSCGYLDAHLKWVNNSGYRSWQCKEIPHEIIIYDVMRGGGRKELDLRWNQLIRVTPLVQKLRKLEFLDLRDNPPLKSLPNFLWKMPTLKTVKVNSNLLEYIPGNASISSEPLRRSIDNGKVVKLLLARKNNEKWSDKDLLKFFDFHDCIVQLKK